MTKHQFLEQLEKLLSILSYNERRDILYDYEEHFNEKLATGISEEEIANRLGSPETIAQKYLPDLPALIENDADTKKEYSQNYCKPPKGNSSGVRVILTLTLIFLNLCFVIPLYLSLFAADIGFIISFFSLAIAGITILISIIFGAPFTFVTFPHALLEYPVLGVTGSLALISLSGLLLIAFIYIFKFLITFITTYVKWNAKIVRGY